MKKSLLFISLASMALLSLGCQNAEAPAALVTYDLTATMTENNVCTVNVDDHTFTSIGQIRVDVPPTFIGTLNKNYHGFGCYVGVIGNDGDIRVVFSGNTLGKPLAVGTYSLTTDILDETPPMTAAIIMTRVTLGGDRYRSVPGSGSVVVTATPSGGRNISVSAKVYIEHVGL